jgi:hypothetical protein
MIKLIYDQIKLATNMILESSVMKYFHTSNVYDSETIKNIVRNNEKNSTRICVRFPKYNDKNEGASSSEADTNCVLCIEYVDHTNLRADGSIWVTVTAKIDVSWPSQCQCNDLVIAHERLMFYDEVTCLAIDISKAILPQTEFCIRSIDKVASSNKARSRIQILDDMCQKMRKGMCIGNKRDVPMDMVINVRSGTYNFEYADKLWRNTKGYKTFTYVLNIQENISVLTRTS